MSEFPGIFTGIETEFGFMARGAVDRRGQVEDVSLNSTLAVANVAFGMRPITDGLGDSQKILLAQMFPDFPELSGQNGFLRTGDMVYPDHYRPEACTRECHSLRELGHAYYTTLRLGASACGSRVFHDPKNPVKEQRFYIELDTNVIDGQEDDDDGDLIRVPSWGVHHNIAVLEQYHPKQLTMQKYYALAQLGSFFFGSGHVVRDPEKGYKVIRSQRVKFIDKHDLAGLETTTPRRALVNTRDQSELSRYDQPDDPSEHLNRAHIINQEGQRIERSMLERSALQLAVVAAAHSTRGRAVLDEFLLADPIAAVYAIGTDAPSNDTEIELRGGRTTTISQYLEDLSSELSQDDYTGDPDVQDVLDMTAADMRDYRDDRSSAYGRQDAGTKEIVIDRLMERDNPQTDNGKYVMALRRSHEWNTLDPEQDLSKKVRAARDKVDSSIWSPLGCSDVALDPTGRAAVRGNLVEENSDAVASGHLTIGWHGAAEQEINERTGLRYQKGQVGSITADIPNGGAGARIIYDAA